MATSPRAIPVRVRNQTWRNIVLRADPEFNLTSQEVPEYEFTRRTFTGRYAQRGPYGSDAAYEAWLASQYVEPGYVQTGYFENDEFVRGA